MTRTICAEPLASTAFAPFGDVLEAVGAPDKMIDQGRGGRFHDRDTFGFVERHPEGAQAFSPRS